jgi:peptidoglycan/LPS O-acetylase OafA/YrhL
MVSGEGSTAVTGFLSIVDVLRAVAIAGVVAYHVLPAAVSGGLVGVDVFFVVSGFLIFGQLSASLRDTEFSLAGFYRRRVLRILPPYAIVVCASTIAACIVLVTPQDLRTYQADLGWSGAFAANIHYADIVGYFDNAAERHILLHLWSLGVEEQFYIVAPLAMLALYWRAGPRLAKWRLALIVGVGVLVGTASFVSVLASDDRPSEAFYLPQFRAWEFLLGGGVQVIVPYMQALRPWLRDAMIIAGLALIVLAMGGYPAAISYPGWFTLLPVVGAAVVIAAGVERTGTLVRVLANRPVLFVGLISYELYLFHWPVLVLARATNFGDLSFVQATACVLGALVLATVTHLALSRIIGPLRRWKGHNLVILATGLLIYSAITVALYIGTGQVTQRVAAELPPLLVPDLQRSKDCNILRANSSLDGCTPAKATRGTGLLMGDSHAGANFTVLRERLGEDGAGLEFAAFPGCSPFLSVDRRQDSDPAQCRSWHAEVRRVLETGKGRYTFAILSAQWMFHVDDLIGADQEGAFKIGLATDISLLQAAGVRRILVIGSPPLLRREPGDCVVRADRFGFNRNEKCAVTRARYDAQKARIDDWIRIVTSDNPAVRFVDPEPVFCDQTWCSPVSGEVALFSDHDHLSRAGTEALAAGAEADLDWVVSGAEEH